MTKGNNTWGCKEGGKGGLETKLEKKGGLQSSSKKPYLGFASERGERRGTQGERGS